MNSYKVGWPTRQGSIRGSVVCPTRKLLHAPSDCSMGCISEALAENLQILLKLLSTPKTMPPVTLTNKAIRKVTMRYCVDKSAEQPSHAILAQLIQAKPAQHHEANAGHQAPP